MLFLNFDVLGGFLVWEIVLHFWFCCIGESVLKGIEKIGSFGEGVCFELVGI